jgi:hypothetical protein
MGKVSFKNVIAAAAIVACSAGVAFGITPNTLVSGGLPAHTGLTTTDYLTDGYLTNWKSSSAKEIALKVGEGPKKLLINWESFGDCAWVALHSHSRLASHPQLHPEHAPLETISVEPASGGECVHRVDAARRDGAI